MEWLSGCGAVGGPMASRWQREGWWRRRWSGGHCVGYERQWWRMSEGMARRGGGSGWERWCCGEVWMKRGKRKGEARSRREGTPAAKEAEAAAWWSPEMRGCGTGCSGGTSSGRTRWGWGGRSGRKILPRIINFNKMLKRYCLYFKISTILKLKNYLKKRELSFGGRWPPN